MALFHNVTRGGQVHIHQLRMIRQVLWFALTVSFFTSVGYFSVKTYRVIPTWGWHLLWEYHVAELNVALVFFTVSKSLGVKGNFVDGNDENKC